MFITIGILTSVLIPIFIFINISITNKNVNLFYQETMQTNSFETLGDEKFYDTKKNLNSNSKAMKYSMALLPNISYVPVLNSELFAWKLYVLFS